MCEASAYVSGMYRDLCAFIGHLRYNSCSPRRLRASSSLFCQFWSGRGAWSGEHIFDGLVERTGDAQLGILLHVPCGGRDNVLSAVAMLVSRYSKVVVTGVVKLSMLLSHELLPGSSACVISAAVAAGGDHVGRD